MSDTFDSTTVGWVFSDEDLEYCLADLDTYEWVTFDLETTGLNEHATKASIVLVSLTLNERTWIIPLDHPMSPFLGHWRSVATKLAEHFIDKKLVGHNVKFDCRWIYAHTGVDLSKLIAWDTQISSHLLDENRSTKLKERAPDTFGVDRWDDVTLTYEGAAKNEPLDKLGYYAARDTYWTAQLLKRHRSVMVENNEALAPDEIEVERIGSLAKWGAMPTIRTLTALEQRGMVLDTQWTQDRIDNNETTRQQLHDKLVNRYEGLSKEDASFAPTSKWFQAWTDKAIDAGDLKIGALTPTGKPQWNKNVLVRQRRAGSEVAEQLLEYRDKTKENEFLNSWLKLVDSNSLIHASYASGRVVSGRLSCSSPNLQQCSRVLKPAFIPRDGYYIAEIDYSQIELRVAAFISQCQPMIEAFHRNDDLHRILASQITGKSPEDVTAEERQQGKVANFGLLYQMQPPAFREYAESSYGVSFTLEEANTIYRAFFYTWEGLHEWHLRQIHEAVQTGQVVSPIGRVRRLPDIHCDHDLKRGHAERQAINSPVQGLGSDIMQIAAGCIEGTIDGYDGVSAVKVIGTVHDSIVVEVPKDDWKRATGCCMKLMGDVPTVLTKLECSFDIPLKAEAKVGTRWGLADVGTIK